MFIMKSSIPLLMERGVVRVYLGGGGTFPQSNGTPKRRRSPHVVL